MLTHAQIWRAIDALAARHGLSASGLAKQAGLDPTSFNKSKRGAAGGKLRWPSTESIAKMLAATGVSLQEFIALIDGESGAPPGRPIPLIGLAQAGSDGHFDGAGLPAGQGWEKIAFPDPQVYVLEIAGDGLLPAFRDGDRLVVSPSGSPRRGDRVVVKTKSGEMLAGLLSRMTAQRLELKNFNPETAERSFALSEIIFVHRIIWASQ